MSQLAMLLQEPEAEAEPAGGLTILALRKEGMDVDSPDSRIRRRKSFTERLGLKGMGCCGGPIWGFQANTISVLDDEEDDGARVRDHQEEEEQEQEQEQEGDSEIHHQRPQQHRQEPEVATVQWGLEQPGCAPESPALVSGSMNLAAALAAERHYRASQEVESAAGGSDASMGTPLRVSLMRLLEEADGGGEEEAAAEGSDSVCCVCMGRKKGAAFIPCGHTYCRVCSRELWLNRGSCPLCNRPILEILDIF